MYDAERKGGKNSLMYKESLEAFYPIINMYKLFIALILLACVGSATCSEYGVVERVIKLSSPTLEVNLDPSAPVIISYKSATKDGLLFGAPNRLGPEVIFYDGDDAFYLSSYEKEARVDCTVKSGPSAAVYSCRLVWKGKPTVDFELIFSVAGNKLSVTTRLLREMGTVRISSIKLPLVTVYSEQRGAKLALPTNLGRLFDIAKAEQEIHFIKADKSNIAAIGMAYYDKMLGLVTISSLDDQIISTIGGRPKYGGLSAEFVRRPRADKTDLSFLVQSDSTCTVTIIEPRDDTPVDWTAGAAAVRDTVPRNINSMYTGSFMYKIMLDRPGSPTWTTFNEALDLVRRVKRLTNGAAQIAYLEGWQRDGRDIGYPDTGALNERVGILDQLRTLIRRAKQENATISVRDNYADAYKDGASWNPGIIALDSSGEMVEGDPGGLGQAYTISPGKYIKTASDRAKRTVQLLGIEKTIHLDTLTDDPDVIDYNPASPTGRQKNAAAKLSIISEFERMGLNVTSDTLTAPFVTEISHFWNAEHNPAVRTQAESHIPLIPMVYHGKVTVGGNISADDDMLDILLFGWTFSEEFTKNTSDERIMDLYYLVTLPWSGLASREISGYKKDGSVERITYNVNTYVEVDKSKKTYKIVRDGTTIASDFSTMIPIPDGRIAVYSRKGGKITVELPESWNESKKIAVAHVGDAEKSSYRVKDGKLTLIAMPRTPYWISYKGK